MPTTAEIHYELRTGQKNWHVFCWIGYNMRIKKEGSSEYTN